jgi:hypothetical protein
MGAVIIASAPQGDALAPFESALKRVGRAWVIAPSGEHRSTRKAPGLPADFAWRDVDARIPYMTARPGLYRILPRPA